MWLKSFLYMIGLADNYCQAVQLIRWRMTGVGSESFCFRQTFVCSASGCVRVKAITPVAIVFPLVGPANLPEQFKLEDQETTTPSLCPLTFRE